MTEFVELDDSNFDEKIGSCNKGLVDFYASWCGACRLAAPLFKRVATELGLELFKVEAEQNTLARSRVTIENLPTVALIKNGKIVGSIATAKEESLREFMASHGIK